jgi:hypothetical protein
MPYLRWINDQNLEKAVQNLIFTAITAKKEAKRKFGKNVVDPFSAIFEMAGFAMDYDSWVGTEESRQAQKTLQNFVGEFHQHILGFCDGWDNMGRGQIVDLLSTKHKIIAEVKNKFNTVSGGKLSGHYYSMNTSVMSKTSIYKGYTAYFVEIIPKKPIRYDIPFVPSDASEGQKTPTNELIRKIDGMSFYELVTGDTNALSDLYNVLPTVVKKIEPDADLDSVKLRALFKIAYG